MDPAAQHQPQLHPKDNLTSSNFLPNESVVRGGLKHYPSNWLAFYKLSQIVASYYQNEQKLAIYSQQIQSLVVYNKRLITILGQFEAQEQRLIKRLRRMQEINIQYMREYCQVKGREFKMPNLPEHRSIFGNFSLQDVQYRENGINPNGGMGEGAGHYRDEIMGIFREFFLTKQDRLLATIEEELGKVHQEGEVKSLLQIKNLIKQYHESMQEPLQQKQLQLLRKRSQIRLKVQQFYDYSHNKSIIKPDYTSQQNALDKIISLHSELQVKQSDIHSFLEQERSLYNQRERERIQYQNILEQKCQSLEEVGKLREEGFVGLREEKIRLEGEVRDLKDEILAFRARLSEKVEIMEGEAQTQDYVQRLETEIQDHKQLIKQYEQQLLQTKEQYAKELTTMAYKIELLQQENKKMRQDRYLVQNLATQIDKALGLVSSLTTNPAIKKKFDSISQRLKEYVKEYQRDMQWDINRQAPSFFQNTSLQHIDGRTHRSSEPALQHEKIAHSFDISNIPLLKQKIRIDQQRRKNMLPNRSLVIERPIELNISLDLSHQNIEQRNDRDEFENMRRQYQQALQCLQMQEKKTRAMEIEYQRYVEIVMNKQKLDPDQYSLEKQLVYLTRLDLEQNETIKQQRRKFNETFRQNLQQFKDKMAQKMNQLRSQPLDTLSDKKMHHTIV